MIKKELAKLEADEASKSDEEDERPIRETPEEMRKRLAEELRHKIALLGGVLAERIHHHLRNVWFKGNQALFEYWWDYVAWMLQRQYKPIKIFWMMMGDQGVGKNAILDWVRERFMGNAVTRQTENQEAVLSKFSGDLKTNVLFLQMDELSGNNGKSKIVDHMKRLVYGDSTPTP